MFDFIKYMSESLLGIFVLMTTATLMFLLWLVTAIIYPVFGIGLLVFALIIAFRVFYVKWLNVK